jgi:hypothetical protein
MNIRKAMLGGAAVVALSMIPSSSQAQTVAFSGIGSSALTLALGQAASTSGAGVNATCVWSFGSNAVQATDPTLAGSNTPDHETGNVWIAWTPGGLSGTSCTTITSSTKVYAYLQTDSVVGDRCLFNGCIIGPGTAGDPTTLATANMIQGAGHEQTNVPTSVWNALNGKAVTGAGTDIRPEDAQFAVNRALASCNTSVAGSNYQGLGYSNGDAFKSNVSSSTFRTITFDITSSPFTVTTVGASPIIVASVGSGFSGTANLSSDTLAAYLSGTYTGSVAPASTILIREALSGTYNTMEYNNPNTVSRQLSQDVGNAVIMTNDNQQNCNGSTPRNGAPLVSGSPNTAYTLDITTAGGGVRERAIGTGEELSTLFANSGNALGYAFWSTANFQNAGSNTTSRYFTIDGVEPLENSHPSNSVIPTPANGQIGNVTLANVANGSYPIWSKIRLVNLGSSASAGATALATAAQNFSTFGSATSHPDFVLTNSLNVVRSHFAPPGVSTTPNNGGSCGAEEGGDVGGQILALNNCTTGLRN